MATTVPKQTDIETTIVSRLCSECGREFKSRSGYSRHALRTCTILLFREDVFYKDKLTMHRNHTHGEEARETCDKCGKRFATRQQVAKYASVVHCEARPCLHYTSKQGLQDHIASQHEGQAVHACHCDKTYMRATNLLQTKKSSKN